MSGRQSKKLRRVAAAKISCEEETPGPPAWPGQPVNALRRHRRRFEALTRRARRLRFGGRAEERRHLAAKPPRNPDAGAMALERGRKEAAWRERVEKRWPQLAKPWRTIERIRLLLPIYAVAVHVGVFFGSRSCRRILAERKALRHG